ncbi:MAG: hypothetical protein F6J89_13695 [Symploca sp. SIO1C4]|uniref:Uncharacterized protein n=1 Tax=Symploca sp. SIO1C4 TaxID=2607765 RepID=A0A6B3NH71_9CYAN|nr:hypothetical protein [Symploca sp. SIO1C4]
MTTQVAYIREKFEEFSLSEDFAPILNRKGQAKLAFIEAIPSIVERGEDEFARLQFRFICDGVKGSQVISYTGWLNESFTRHSRLGTILEKLGVVDFPKSEKEVVQEFDFEEQFKEKETSSAVTFEELMDKLQKLEGTLLLAELVCENDIWHRPDPKTFEFPKNKTGDFYKTDVSAYKQT